MLPNRQRNGELGGGEAGWIQEMQIRARSVLQYLIKGLFNRTKLQRLYNSTIRMVREEEQRQSRKIMIFSPLFSLVIPGKKRSLQK